MKRHRQLPFGAEIDGDAVRFRLWAPGADTVQLAIEGGETLPMEPSGDGFYELRTHKAKAGTRYRYKIGDLLVPDPVARYQPQSLQGASEVVDAEAFDWSDANWKGRPWHEQVLYELHVGSFSGQGGFDGVIEHFDHLLSLGITTIELMPVAECPGRWNWGYDGVLLYAVEECYGGPQGLKRLVDAAHAKGLSVMLDVVYNHFGPDGNYLHSYAPDFFTDKHRTPWGAGINFDDRHSEVVRRFFIENALYWLQEYHLDGLRFDAVHAIADDSNPDFVTELGTRIRETITDRHVHLVLENDQNRSSVLGFGYAGSEPGPGPFTAQWNDDYHHVLRVAVTGNTSGYYGDYANEPLKYVARVLAEGFAYQGEVSEHRDGANRGEPSKALPATAFVSFIQNHDQVGNHAYGWRLHHFASDEAIRAATAILLLGPQIPMLWMGQEWNCEQPFPFFCDFTGDLADAVRKGRAEEFRSFPEFQSEQARKRIPDPLAESTFASAVLDWSKLKQASAKQWLALNRDLLRLRREHVQPLLARGGAIGSAGVDNGVLNVQWRFADASVLQLIANLSDRPRTYGEGEVLGRSLYSTAKLEGRELPPWYVAVNKLDQEGAVG